MSVEKKQTTNDTQDPKAKFREVLEKKKQGSGVRNNNRIGGPKISGRQSEGNAPKMFRRKSGTA